MKEWPRRSLAAGQGLEVGEEFGTVPVLRANDFAGDTAIATDDVGFRVHRGAVLQGDLFRGIAVGREVDPLRPEESVVGGGVIVHADAQHGDSLWRKVLLQAVQRRHLFDAGRAPGGPEIEHHDLAAQVSELGRLAVKVEVEIMRGAAGRSEERRVGKEGRSRWSPYH